MLTRRLISLALVCLFALPAWAQEAPPPTLRLDMDTTQLQTGQEYEVRLRVDNALPVWSGDFDLRYDPDLLYVIGTAAGSPVRQGEFFGTTDSIIVRNGVLRDHINYTISRLAPAEPEGGSGVIGTFRIYPLAPGTTQIRFSDAELSAVMFTGEGDARRLESSIPVEFTAVLLDVTITGDPVPPPSEATATPEPTETPARFSPHTSREGELANVTAAPATPTAASNVTPSTPAGVFDPVMLVAIGVMLVGAVGLLVVIIVWRRSRRR